MVEKIASDEPRQKMEKQYGVSDHKNVADQPGQQLMAKENYQDQREKPNVIY